MKPVAELKNDMKLHSIVGVLTDVDDTLTRAGQLNSRTYQALWDLHDAGYKVVPVTGRSTGWAHLMMTQWPVDAVVAESGGSWLTRKGSALQIHHYDQQAVQRRLALMALCKLLIARFSPLQFALDNDYRCVDVAVDYNEQVVLSDDKKHYVEQFIALVQAQGFHAKASSIHINAWAGQFDKAPGTLRLLNEFFPEHNKPEQWVFIGDAPNDQSMFEAFTNSVGVANLLPHMSAGLLSSAPQYITSASHGDGFCELADLLISHRNKKRIPGSN